MPTAAEALARTDCDDLRKELETRDRCIAVLNARVNRLNALLVTLERERTEADATITALRAELAELRAGIVAPPY